MIDLSADIQDAELVQELLRQNDKLTTFSGREPPFGNLDWWPISVFFNSEDERWNDVRVRKALSYAIDPEQILDFAFGGAGQLSNGPFPAFPPLQKYNDMCTELAATHDVGVYNPDRSAELMQEAGFEKDTEGFWAKDGQRAGGDMYGLAITNQIGPLIQQQLRRSGFDVTHYATPDSSRIIRAGNCPLVLAGHSNSSIFDPLATLEPTSALDVVTQRQVMETLGKLQKQTGCCLILIGHDMGLMAQFVDRLAVMYAGKIIEIGSIEQLFRDPRHPYTRMLIDSVPTLKNRKLLAGLPGAAPSLARLPPGCSFAPRCPFAMDICRSVAPADLPVGDRRVVACHLEDSRVSVP